MKYYELDNILAKNAHYNFVIGERSNGKTTAVLRHIVKDYYETGRRGAIIRQMEEDIKGHKGASLFAGMISAGMIDELTDGEFQGVKFHNRAYYLGRQNEMGEWIYEKEPFAHIFAVSQAIHYKSNSYPNVGTIMFDEFMRQDHVYLVDEVVQFLNLVSTIVREKNDAIIFLIANTVSWNSPYFKKFGLKNVSQMKPGTIATVEYKRKRPTGKELVMTVAIEYCENTASYGGKASDVYFLIDDERVNMITDGSFAIPSYPPCPHHFTAENVKLTCWVISDETILRCRLMKVGREVFFFVDTIERFMRQPGETVGSMQPDWERFNILLDKRRDLVYSMEFSSDPSHYTNPAMPYADRRTRWFPDALRANRVFFESNEAGEELMYYLTQAQKHSITTL
jgi:encapsidation protein